VATLVSKKLNQEKAYLYFRWKESGKWNLLLPVDGRGLSESQENDSFEIKYPLKTTKNYLEKYQRYVCKVLRPKNVFVTLWFSQVASF